MPTRVVETELDRSQLLKWLGTMRLPFTVSAVKGRKRSVEQNRLQRQWLNEISDQFGDRTPEEVRGYCKLTIGVPILRAENEDFCSQYDRVIRPLPYESKLAIMMEPLDLPVTRLMTTDQKRRYLDAVYTRFTEQGLVLTLPEDRHAVTDRGGREIQPMDVG